MKMKTRAIILLLCLALAKMPSVTLAATNSQSFFQPPPALADISSLAANVFSGAGETIRGWVGGAVCYFISCPNGKGLAANPTATTTAVIVSNAAVPISTTKTVYVPVNTSHPTQPSYIYP